MPQLLTATGSAISSAGPLTIIDKKVTQLTATGSATSFGSAAVLRKLPVGGLTDFGIWDSDQVDTAMTRDMGHSSFAENATASRGYLNASAPVAYDPAGTGTPLWNTAAYAAVGIKYFNLNANEAHVFDKVQVERATPGNRLSWNATSWEGASCYSGDPFSSYCTVETSTDKALSGKKSGKITYDNSFGDHNYNIMPASLAGVAPCTPGELINGSVSVSMQRSAWWYVSLRYFDSSFSLVSYTDNTSAYIQHPGGGQWQTGYAYQMTVPANAVWVAVVPLVCAFTTPTSGIVAATNGEIVYCDMHKIWGASYNIAGTPSTYVSPRSLTIELKANRVNLITNPSIDGSFGWADYYPNNTTFTVATDSTGRTKPGSFKATATNTSATQGTFWLGTYNSPEYDGDRGGYGLQPNTRYTLSAYVLPGPGCSEITLDVPYTLIKGVTSSLEAMQDPDLVEGSWIRLWAVFETPDDTNGLIDAGVFLDVANVPAGTTQYFYLDDVMCEAGEALQDYFDGNFPGEDYLWSGSAGSSTSHYYREFRSSSYRLNGIVKSAVPHGTTFKLLYAQPPT